MCFAFFEDEEDTMRRKTAASRREQPMANNQHRNRDISPTTTETEMGQKHELIWK